VPLRSRYLRWYRRGAKLLIPIFCAALLLADWARSADIPSGNELLGV
jgi:hypothetical protein